MFQHIVAGIIKNNSDCVLLSQRPMTKDHGGYWEFPGGKKEEGESPFEGLKREFLEELGIVIIKAELFLQVPHQYPTKKILLDIWQITEFSGKPMGLEGQAIAWKSIQELSNLVFPEANLPVIEKLKLTSDIRAG